MVLRAKSKMENYLLPCMGTYPQLPQEIDIIVFTPETN